MRHLRLVPFAIVLLMGGCLCSGTPGDGEKIGSIVKLSRVGIFCKTWEAQIIRGGMNGGSGSFGTVPFDFTVEREEDVATVKRFMETQEEVLLRYRTEGIASACRTDEGHFLTSITPVKH